MSHYMKKPCEHCPFRNDVKPFLHPERAEEIANSTSNPYNSFPCHKTTVPDEDSEENQMLVTDKSKECYGFMAIQINENGNEPEDWSWEYADKIYPDAWSMIDAYQEQWNHK